LDISNDCRCHDPWSLSCTIHAQLGIWLPYSKIQVPIHDHSCPFKTWIPTHNYFFRLEMLSDLLSHYSALTHVMQPFPLERGELRGFCICDFYLETCGADSGLSDLLSRNSTLTPVTVFPPV
jgi:hypothetical protein